MSKILVVDDDSLTRGAIELALAGAGHTLLHASNGESGLAVLVEQAVDLVITDLKMPVMNGQEFLVQLRRDHPDLKCIMITADSRPDNMIGALREHVCDLLAKPFTVEQLRKSVSGALVGCPATEVEVVSAQPEWVELRIPCELATVSPIEKFFTRLESDLPEEVYEAVDCALREMLNNAIEHGCGSDRAKRVEVTYVRLKRAIICWIKDPGPGFDPARLDHAAVSNPANDPVHHLSVREEKGLRAGGFGILMTNQMVDELVYNERRNELMFIKYLS